MLLPTMTPDEVRRELQDDFEDLRRWMRYSVKKWQRMARQHVTPEHSLTIIGDYKTPHRKNVWVFSLRICDRRMNNVQLCTGVLSWQQEGMAWTFLGRYRDEHPFCDSLRPPMPADMLGRMRWCADRPLIIRFLPHFWLRLRERTGDRRYGLDLVKHFIELNDWFGVSDDHTVMNPTGRRMDDSVTFVLHSGAALGQRLQPMFYDIRTYIHRRQEMGQQRETHVGLREKLPEVGQLVPLDEAVRMKNRERIERAAVKKNDRRATSGEKASQNPTEGRPANPTEGRPPCPTEGRSPEPSEGIPTEATRM